LSPKPRQPEHLPAPKYPNQKPGNGHALSLNTVPAVTKSLKNDGLSAGKAAQIWRNVYNAGKSQNPFVALGSAASLGFCAWTARNLPFVSSFKNPRLFWVAAALTIGIVPYTAATMMTTNNKLLRFAEKAEKEELSSSESSEVGVLLERWTVLNGIRSLMPLAGAVIAGVVVLV
jgi:hypothetical protein